MSKWKRDGDFAAARTILLAIIVRDDAIDRLTTDAGAAPLQQARQVTARLS